MQDLSTQTEDKRKKSIFIKKFEPKIHKNLRKSLDKDLHRSLTSTRTINELEKDAFLSLDQNIGTKDIREKDFIPDSLNEFKNLRWHISNFFSTEFLNY